MPQQTIAPGGAAGFAEHIPYPTSVRDAVLMTVSYFDAQGLPLTSFECWRNLLFMRATLKEVRHELEHLAEAGTAEQIDGYYSLRGQEHVLARQLKLKQSEFKWRRARVAAWLLSLVPFVEAAAVVDSVALNKAKPGSDIDFFVVVKPGRIWTARLIATALTQTLGLRRHGKKVKDRACLSFYATREALALERLAIEGGDPYLAQWVFLVTPLWQRKGFSLAGTLQAKNPWAQQYFLQAEPPRPTNRRRVMPSMSLLSRPLQAFAELVLRGRLGNWLEQKVRKVQLHYMHKEAPYEVKSRSSHIVISDSMLKFHEEDRRTWFRERMVAMYQQLRTDVASKPRSLRELGDTSIEGPEVRFGSSGLMVQPIGATVRLDQA